MDFQMYWPLGRAGDEDVVVPVDLVEAGALHQAELVGLGEHVLGPDLGAHVRGELRDADLVGAVRHVRGAVVVEEQPRVVVNAADLGVPGPGARRVGGAVYVRPLEADLAQPVEGLVAGAVAHRGRPDAPDVRPSALEVVRVAEVEDRHRVADELPVDQVVGAQDGRARRVVHGRAGVVVRVADADDLEVGEVLPDHRVGELLLLGRRGRRRAHRRQRGARDQADGGRHDSPAAVGVLEPGHSRSASSRVGDRERCSRYQTSF